MTIMLTRLHLFDQKYSKNFYIVIYYVFYLNVLYPDCIFFLMLKTLFCENLFQDSFMIKVKISFKKQTKQNTNVYVHVFF